MKETPRASSFAKDHFHRSEAEVHSSRSCKNGGRDSTRYHFGMSKQHDDKVERNGRECNKQTEDDNADVLYKKSREHFGSWDIKDIVQDDARKSRKQDLEDARLTNGKFRKEPAKVNKLQQDRLEYRDEGYVGSLPRENRQRSGSVERELNGSHRSKEMESWEEDAESRNRKRTFKSNRSNDRNNDQAVQPVDERDILLKEIENLATDGSQSPDRRIQAMIERLKSREENKLRSRREQRSASPEKEAHNRTRSGCRSDHSLDNRFNDRARRPKDDREDERRPSESKPYGKSDREEDTGRRDRSADRRSRSIERQSEDRGPRRDDSFRKRSDERDHRRNSKEEEDQSRSRDSSKRRSYTYEGSPEDFDVKIQRYDRALPEPRRDSDRGSPRRNSPRRSSPREPNVGRKESSKEHDPVTRKSSFGADSKRATSKDRDESNLIRKTSFKDQFNDAAHKRHVPRDQHETAVRYFGKDQEDLSRKDSFKDANTEVSKKGFFKVQDGEFGRSYVKNQHDDADKKVSGKEYAGGVSRIVLRNFDDEPSRSDSFKSEDSGKKNSLKEKNIEFAGISCKDHESDSERRKNSFRNHDETSYHDYENNIDRKTANDRYIEFGKISFKTENDELRVSSPFKEEDDAAVVKTSSFKEHDASSTKRRASLRNRGREALDKKMDRHTKPLTSPKKDEPDLSREDNAKDSKNFCAKSWYESNRIFSAKYLRDHGKLRTAEERLDVSPEQGYMLLQDARSGTIKAIEENSIETRGRIDPGDSPQFSSTRDRNGATIIKIRGSEDSGGATERRRRRRPVQEMCVVRRRKYEDDDEDSDEDEEEDRRRRTRRDGGILPGRGGGDAGGTTPSRTIWNYREGVWHFHESIAFDRSFMVQRREAIFINRWRR